MALFRFVVMLLWCSIPLSHGLNPKIHSTIRGDRSLLRQFAAHTRRSGHLDDDAMNTLSRSTVDTLSPETSLWAELDETIRRECRDDVRKRTKSSNGGLGEALDRMTNDVWLKLRPQKSPEIVTAIRRLASSARLEKCVERYGERLRYQRFLGYVGEIYKESVRFRSAIYFLHVSKSGGTAMCSLACRNGCRTPGCDRGRNCWSRDGRDGPKWARSGTGWWVDDMTSRDTRYSNCLLEQRHLIAKAWNFAANENFLFGGEDRAEHVQVCSEEFLNVVMVRNPIDRVISHLDALGEVIMSTSPQEPRPTIRSMMNEYHTVSSNYMTRLLLGENDFHRRTLNDAHLAVARRALSEFDVVLLMDDLFSRNAENVLRYGLGWNVTASSSEDLLSNAKRVRNSGINRTASVSRADLDEIRRANAFDMELYELAVSLASADKTFFNAISATQENTTTPGIPTWMKTRVECRRQCGHICDVEYTFDRS